jgi:acyl-homoserine lactone acylase PvdQ
MASDPITDELLTGYLAGVNSYLDTKPYLPLEMKVLGIQPEHFTRADSIVWAKIMR